MPSDTTPREQIEAWLEGDARFPVAGRDTRLARAALAIIDADHVKFKWVKEVDGCACCDCVWPCPRKAAHESALWEAIRGVGLARELEAERG